MHDAIGRGWARALKTQIKSGEIADSKVEGGGGEKSSLTLRHTAVCELIGAAYLISFFATSIWLYLATM